MTLPPEMVARFVSYLSELRSDVAALADRVDGPEGWSSEVREGLRITAHKLAGTAGSFGFPALGESARGLEAALLDANPKGEERRQALVRMSKDLKAAAPNV